VPGKDSDTVWVPLVPRRGRVIVCSGRPGTDAAVARDAGANCSVSGDATDDVRKTMPVRA